MNAIEDAIYNVYLKSFLDNLPLSAFICGFFLNQVRN
jgi:hypothetical protein